MKNLRIVIPALLLMATIALLQSCTGSHIDRTGFMPPVKIKIPDEVKDDTTMVNFIVASEKVINELSDRMENVALNGKELLGKKDEDMTVMDKIKMTKLSVQFVAVGNSLVNELEKIQLYMDKKQRGGVSKTDMKAYDAVEKAIEKRINALDKKYNNIMSH